MIVELPKEQEERARALHRDAFVFDSCIAIGAISEKKYRDEIMDAGGIDGCNMTAAAHKEDFLGAVTKVNRIKKLVADNSDIFALCTTADQMKQAKKSGKFALVLHFQDSKPIEDNLDYVRSWYEMGIRVIQLTYNVQNWVGSGCCERHDGPLSEFGIDALHELQRWGIVVDLSHCGDATVWDAIKNAKGPIVATHSSMRAVCNAYGRNKTDEQVKAIANTGGMVGITFFPPFIKKDPKTHKVLQATVDDVLDHIDHAVRLVGVDHVGFGSDLSTKEVDTGVPPWDSSIRWYRPVRPDIFGSGPTDKYDPFPLGVDRHNRFINITRGLVKRGHKDEDIKKILGGNWLTLYQRVWK